MEKFCCTECGKEDKYLWEIEGFKTTAYAGAVCEKCLIEIRNLDKNVFINDMKKYRMLND